MSQFATYLALTLCLNCQVFLDGCLDQKLSLSQNILHMQADVLF